MSLADLLAELELVKRAVLIHLTGALKSQGGPLVEQTQYLRQYTSIVSQVVKLQQDAVAPSFALLWDVLLGFPELRPILGDPAFRDRILAEVTRRIAQAVPDQVQD